MAAVTQFRKWSTLPLNDGCKPLCTLHGSLNALTRRLSVYNISDHCAIAFSFEVTLTTPKQVLVFLLFQQSRLHNIAQFVRDNSFEAVCSTNVVIATNNWYAYINNTIGNFVRRRTIHSQTNCSSTNSASLGIFVKFASYEDPWDKKKATQLSSLWLANF